MKALFALSVLSAKLVVLACFSSMGMMAMAMEMDAEIPCHEGEMTQEFALEEIGRASCRERVFAKV